MQAGEHSGQLFRRLHGCDPVEIWPQRPGAEAVDGGFIHASAKVIADFLLVGVAATGLPGELGENAPEELLVVPIELAVDAPTRLVSRDRIVLHPSTAGVLVEVDARVGGLVHGGDVES